MYIHICICTHVLRVRIRVRICMKQRRDTGIAELFMMPDRDAVPRQCCLRGRRLHAPAFLSSFLHSPILSLFGYLFVCSSHYSPTSSSCALVNFHISIAWIGLMTNRLDAKCELCIACYCKHDSRRTSLWGALVDSVLWHRENKLANRSSFN